MWADLGTLIPAWQALNGLWLAKGVSLKKQTAVNPHMNYSLPQLWPDLQCWGGAHCGGAQVDAVISIAEQQRKKPRSMPLHMKITDKMENTMKTRLTLLLRYSRWRATKFHPSSWDVMTVRVHHPLRLGRAHGWLIVWTFHSKGKRKLNSTLQ